MKRLWIALLLIIMLAMPACASTAYLACDPSTDPISQVEIEMTKGTEAPTIVAGSYVVSGNHAFLYDLSNLGNGAWTFRARWGVAGGIMSDWSTSLSTVKVGKPINPTVIKQ